MTVRRWLWRGGLAALAVACLLLAFLATAGFLGGDALRLFPASDDRRPPMAAVLFSGDMGLRFGMGPHVARALAKQGVPVVGVSSSTAFAVPRTRQQVNAIVAGAIQAALDRTDAARLLVVGQSFGADVARVGLASLPAPLRERIAAIVLVVPGRDAWFRADPSGLSYRGAPDAGPPRSRALDWAPLVCIRGAAETNSLCPLLTGANVHAITLPGGHFLDNDHRLLVRTILQAVRPVLPAASERGR